MELILSNRSLSQSFYEELLVSFLTQQGASKKTQKNYLSDVRDFVDFMKSRIDSTEFTVEHLAKVSSNDIRHYMSKLSKEKSASTATRHLSSLRTFFKALNAAGLHGENPAEVFNSENQRPYTVSGQESSLLANWKERRKAVGHKEEFVKTDARHVEEFLIWIKKNRNI